MRQRGAILPSEAKSFIGTKKNSSSSETDTEKDDAIVLKQRGTLLRSEAKSFIDTKKNKVNAPKQMEAQSSIIPRYYVHPSKKGKNKVNAPKQMEAQGSIIPRYYVHPSKTGKSRLLTKAKLHEKRREPIIKDVKTVNSAAKTPALLPSVSNKFYDVELPVTAYGILINVANFSGNAVFTGYRKFPSGEAGPAERHNLMGCRGDKIVQVNGEECEGKPFRQVIEMMVEATAGKQAICHLRMQHMPY